MVLLSIVLDNIVQLFRNDPLRTERNRSYFAIYFFYVIFLQMKLANKYAIFLQVKILVFWLSFAKNVKLHLILTIKISYPYLAWSEKNWTGRVPIKTQPLFFYPYSNCTHVDSARWQLPQVASSKWIIFSFVFVTVSCFLSIWSEELQNYWECKKVHFPAAKCSEEILGSIIISEYFNINLI
jgi:hypothetical protein